MIKKLFGDPGRAVDLVVEFESYDDADKFLREYIAARCLQNFNDYVILRTKDKHE